MTNEQLKKILLQTVEKLKIIMGQDYELSILYGSYARGDFDDESDVDIAVLVGCDRLEAKKYIEPLADIMTDISLSHNILLSFCCIPIEEFNDKKEVLPFYRNIEKEGVELVA